MSWSRFDDNWTRKIQALGVSFPARWHYMAMIQTCSATDAYDGEMIPSAALACSDVPDAMACLDELCEIGLVTRHVTRHGERYTVIDIEDHVPPKSMRDKPRKNAGAARTQRYRAHKAGDHSQCLPSNCPDAPVTEEVTRHPGTGQDGPGREELPDTAGTRDEAPAWPTSPRPGVVDLSTGEVDEDDYLRSLGVCSRCGGQGCPGCVAVMERSA